MPVPANLTPLEREPSREIIYRRLKTLILDLTLEPLEVLRDTELAAQLGVSRTPVREALRKLEDEGFIESQRNQWTRISPIEPRHLFEMYPIAQALHVTALRLAFDHLSQEDHRALRGANDGMSKAIAAGRAADALRFDAEFHQIIVVRADNPILAQLVTSLTEKLQRIELAHFRQVKSGSASVAEHQALIRAIRSKDIEAAIRHMSTNWECPTMDDDPREQGA
jgi:DNA-binding GntR family transcriptional regulator